MRTPLAVLSVIAVFPSSLFSAPSLRVHPSEVLLEGPGSRQYLVIQSVHEGQVARDVSSETKLRIKEGGLASVGRDVSISGLADGETSLVVEWQGQKVEVPVKIHGAGAQKKVSFRLDVEPVFMRAGCNSGSCHGSARGQDGFRLSLFGYDPVGDYFRLTREYPGRRIDPVEPAKSLLLEKALGTVTHTGGECFKADSEYYQTLKTWITEGAQDDAAGAPTVTGIQLLPEKMLLKSSKKTTPKHRTIVMANYSDGTRRDISRLALFLTNNDAVASIDKDGVIKAAQSGGAFVFARFDRFTVGAEVIVLPESTEFHWPDDASPQNYVDDAVFARLKQLQIAPSATADDETFLRRTCLDLTGLPPDAEATAAFLADKDPQKREKLVDKLLASEEFTDLWTMKWSEILQVKANLQNPDTGRSKKATWKYYQWLRGQIAANRPFNDVIRDLITAQGSNVANPQANYFTTANGNRRTAMERAEDTAQLFLGTRLQCAQCHNHPFDRWTMDDYYGFTAFFGGVSQKRGATATEVFIYNQNEKCVAEHPVDGRKMTPRYLGGEDIKPDADPREALAVWLTSPDNKVFARNLANRAWSHFFGRGVIEPVDDARISNPPSNEELLAVMAAKLAERKFDLRALLRDICTSRTYQLSSMANDSNATDDRYFSRSYVRRLQAEVLLDTVHRVTGTPSSLSGQMPGTRAVQIFDGGADKESFLKNFGASKRETVCACEVRMEPTLTQTLALINGSTLDSALQRSPFLNELAAAPEPQEPEQAVEKIFLRALARKPSPYEVGRIMSSASELDLKDKNIRRKFYEDVLWGVMNTTEFTFNH